MSTRRKILWEDVVFGIMAAMTGFIRYRASLTCSILTRCKHL